MNQGKLVAIEGIDGAGKSTLARTLYITLTQKGIPTLLTKEPGGTELGAYIRTMLVRQPSPIGSKAEYLLFAADRAQHFHEIIEPALKQGYIIISDRLADSSLVYQGYGRGLDIATLDHINKWTMDKIVPDITIYIRLTFLQARQRLAERTELSPFEKAGQSFIEKIIHGFDVLYQNRSNVLILNGADSPDIVAQKSLEAIMKLSSKAV